MSVIVVGKRVAHPANVTRVWQERQADFQAVQKDALAAGAIHHRWGFGDGYVIIVDEWPDAASFQGFFQSNTMIPSLMEEAGVQGEPEFIIAEAASGPDEF